mmetsp:Transcript_17545/g.53146  ORF Transcript_17545/g.53146 Transcript_17545/m.53146 type:complete len:393 (-) Transcript_17545:425-1603(-)
MLRPRAAAAGLGRAVLVEPGAQRPHFRAELLGRAQALEPPQGARVVALQRLEGRGAEGARGAAQGHLRQELPQQHPRGLGDAGPGQQRVAAAGRGRLRRPAAGQAPHRRDLAGAAAGAPGGGAPALPHARLRRPGPRGAEALPRERPAVARAPGRGRGAPRGSAGVGRLARRARRGQGRRPPPSAGALLLPAEAPGALGRRWSLLAAAAGRGADGPAGHRRCLGGGGGRGGCAGPRARGFGGAGGGGPGAGRPGVPGGAALRGRRHPPLCHAPLEAPGPLRAAAAAPGARRRRGGGLGGGLRAPAVRHAEALRHLHRPRPLGGGPPGRQHARGGAGARLRVAQARARRALRALRLAAELLLPALLLRLPRHGRRLRLPGFLLPSWQPAGGLL